MCTFVDSTSLVSSHHPDAIQSPPESDDNGEEENDEENDKENDKVVEVMEAEQHPLILKKCKHSIGEFFSDPVILIQLMLFSYFTIDEEPEEGW